jgi:hypothetical protein
VVETFGEIGVTREQIEARIQCRIDAIRPAQVVQLRKIFASVRDGMSSPADWFEPSVAPVEMPKAKAKAAAAPKAATDAAAPDAEPAPAQDAKPATQAGPAEPAQPLSETQARLLTERMRRAHVTADDVREHYGDVTSANLNTVLSDLRGMVDAEQRAQQE